MRNTKACLSGWEESTIRRNLRQGKSSLITRQHVGNGRFRKIQINALGKAKRPTIFLCQDPCRFYDIKYRLFPNVLGLLIWRLLPGSTTRNVYYLHEQVRNPATVYTLKICVSSHRDLNLFKRAACCFPGVKSVHLKRFLKSRLEVFQ